MQLISRSPRADRPPRPPRPAFFAAPSMTCACALAPVRSRVERTHGVAGARRRGGACVIRRARVGRDAKEQASREDRVGRVVRSGSLRKAVLGTREPISLARSILGADPGQREEKAGSGAVAAAAPAESACQPASPRFAGPACQGKQAHAYQREEREMRECGRPSGPEGGRGVGTC